MSATALVLARGASLAGAMSFAGALLFRVLVAPFPARRLIGASFLLAVLGGAAWFVAQAADFAEVGIAEVGPALAPTAGTLFGHTLELRAVLLVAAFALCGRLPLAAALLAAGAVAIQAGLGHAAADNDVWLTLALAIHLLAASVWLGGLPPLWLALGGPAPERAAHRFSMMALAAVVLLLGTAMLQAAVLIGSVPGLVGTAYGQAALLKFAILAGLLTLAGVNRLYFTPLLPGATVLARLRSSVLIEAALGVAVVFAAAHLALQPPAVHEQPDWPFSWQFSLVFMDEPELRQEVVDAVLALAGAAALVVLGIAVRRVRWVALLAAGVIAWFAAPHFDLLFVPAYPTSFYQSPSGFSAASIAAGAGLYPAHCAGCHGAGGRGDGPLAKGMEIPPADLTAGHLWAHSDGELFWWLAQGMRGPDGTLVMPGFAPTLSDDDRWALIDFIRAHNAGLAFHADGAWPALLPAPGLQAVCDDESDVTLEGYRGHPARVTGAPPADGVDIATIVLAAAPHGCAADTVEARLAYAEIAGLAPGQLADWTFLVDSGGWLRAAGTGLHGAALRDAVTTMGTGPAPPVAGHHH